MQKREGDREEGGRGHLEREASGIGTQGHRWIKDIFACDENPAFSFCTSVFGGANAASSASSLREHTSLAEVVTLCKACMKKISSKIRL